MKISLSLQALSISVLLATAALLAPPHVAFGETVIPSGSNLFWSDYVWNKEGSPYVIEGPTSVRNGSLTVEPGTVIKFASGANLSLHADVSMFVNGTAEEPVYFTSIKDDSVGGDTNGDGAATEPAPGDWGYARIGGGSTTQLNEFSVEYLKVRYGGDTAFSLFEDAVNGIDVRPTLVLMFNWFNAQPGIGYSVSHIEVSQGAGDGMYVHVGKNHSLTVSDSSFHDNAGLGVRKPFATTSTGADGTGVLDLSGNWWGDPSGPFHEDLNPDGTGDGVISTRLALDSWLSEDPLPGTPWTPFFDSLLLQYEPVLYLHPEENYQPMNVEAFVEASALWDDNGLSADTIIKPRGEVTLDDISVGGSEDWYLAFSSDESKTIDVNDALSAYDLLVMDESAVPTYYGYKSIDSFEDSEGNSHEFIVLQYWYFYAFNDWLEHGGLNNHEGDWETVMVFLDKETEEPRYVAYSAHHNDGDPAFNLVQYDSVRRAWNSDEVVKDNEKVASFVSLGSHANYPNNGNGGIHDAFSASDLTSVDGAHLEEGSWDKRNAIAQSSPGWMNYEGKWGADMVGVGTQGPQGPGFLSSLLEGGVIRFQNPIEWAGIDKVEKRIIAAQTDTLDFANLLTRMLFATPLEVGTEVLVDLHGENISFGEKPESATLLSRFWDFTSSLVNDAFEVEVTLQYDPDEVTALGGDENDLRVFLYNEAENLWEQIASTVDTAADTISFTTTHFSRYAIGIVEPPEEDDEEDENKGKGCKSGRNGKSHTFKICNNGHATVINNVKGGANSGGNSANGGNGGRKDDEEESPGPWGNFIRTGDSRTNIDVTNLINRNRSRFRR